MDCWHREIERAKSEDEVVDRAQDYLVLYSPQELEPLKQSDASVRLESGADIVRYQRRLAVGCYESGASHIEPLEELASYFWHAAARIRELRRTA